MLSGIIPRGIIPSGIMPSGINVCVAVLNHVSTC
jgi:hypothetical protein